MGEEEVLIDLTNITRHTGRQICDTVYYFSESDDKPITTLKRSSINVEPIPSTSLAYELIGIENVRLTTLTDGVFVMVKIYSERTNHIPYLPW